MSEKYMEKAGVIRQERLAEGIFDLVLQTEHIAAEAAAGQFVSLYSKSPARLLPRPISLCGIDREAGTIRLVYRVTGENTGTEEFSRLREGETVRLLGPLGNGFPLSGASALLVGGGIGVPPMLELAKSMRREHHKAEITMVMGYRDNRTFLLEEFEEQGRVAVATEDGSVGTRGNVLDAIQEQGLGADVIYACGPLPMLRALKSYAAEQGVECYLSLEERMACGIGACLACVCRSVETDGHTNVHNKRICKEGPVFRALEIEL